MFNNETVNLTIPNGPYPLCGKSGCKGIMMPLVEPATGYDNWGHCEIKREYWIKGTAILFWKCSICNTILKGK